MNSEPRTGPRGEIHFSRGQTVRQGDSRHWRRTIMGKDYAFTAVTMRDGERRYFASRFNGYPGGRRFGCAWTPCFEYIVPAREER
jgi:hypothetical protein